MLSHRLRRAAAGAGAGGGGFTNIKSMVLDCVTNYGAANFAMRSLEMILSGLPITMNNSLASYYGNEFNATYEVANIFDTGASKIGGPNDNEWIATGSIGYRIIAVFNSPVSLEGITINNSHDSGLLTGRGIKDLKITTTPDIFTATVLNDPVTNGTLIFDGVLSEHVAADVIDDQILALV